MAEKQGTFMVDDLDSEITKAIRMVLNGGQTGEIVRVEDYIAEKTGMSEEQIKNLPNSEMDKYWKEALEENRQKAINETKIITLTRTNTDGTVQKMDIVPAALSTARENAMKDHDDEVNYIMNGKQVTKETAQTLSKVARQSIKLADRAGRGINKDIEKAIGEFGR